MAITITKDRLHTLRSRRVLPGVCTLLAGSLLLLPVSAKAQNGSASTGISSTTSALDAPSTQGGPLPLGAGDLIEIQVFNTPEVSSKARIDQQGMLTLPLVGTLSVSGLLPPEAATLIEKRLRDAQILLDPHVSIFVDEYATQGVVLLGEVKSPGTYNLFGPHTLYDALSAAGGVAASQGSSITITHRNDPDHPVIIPVNSTNYSDIQHKTPIYPGDTILVSKATMFYIVGDVLRSGAFYMQNGAPVSVLNALSLASGLNKTAAVSRASIVRPTPGGTGAETIPLDLNKIMRNQAPNPLLAAGDVLVVPRSGTKVFLEFALPALTSGAISAVTTALIVK